ncbi:MAG: 4Fe-4S binding protein [Lentisphaerae bacterium]|nr:4Fe-4S binding protein [Lentisphaerota bacterium]
MKRTLIHIDESKCNGCGRCITACSEGALKLVNGKARLVREDYCDGLGACLGDCPTGALTLEIREAPPLDLAPGHAVPAGTQAHEPPKAAAASEAPACPGLKQRTLRRTTAPGPADGPGAPSALEQWPVQLHLVQPGAPFFRSRELLVLSTCAPVASANVHRAFIRGRGVVVACPKLDRTEGYAEKLGEILKDSSIPAVRVVRMEVPCCGGLTRLVREAAQLSGRGDLRMEEATLGLDGSLQSRTAIE